MTETEIKYTNNQVLGAINRLEEKEKDCLFNQLKVSEVNVLLNDKEQFDQYISYVRRYARDLFVLTNLLEKLSKLIDTPESGTNKVVRTYNELSEAEKMSVAVDLLNHSNFQKDCCKVLVNDFEKVAKTDSTVKALDKLLGFSKYFKQLIELGIGCDHHYDIPETAVKGIDSHE